MIRRFFLLGLVMSMAGVVLAGVEDKEVKLTGYVVDNMCAAAAAKNPEVAEKVKNHPTSCAMMPACAKSGYSVFADGKFYKLDEEGNKRVMRIYKQSKSKNGLAVKVEGTVDGDTIRVREISEAEASGK